MDHGQLSQCFDSLAQEGRELYLDKEVPILDKPPSSLRFLRDWVSPNKPVVIRNVFNHWPANKLWSPDYLREKIGQHEVTVAVTPNGYADAVYQGKFVMPEERTMTFNSFLDILEKKVKDNGIFYVQKQNSNFTDEFVRLMEDAESHIPWATEALGKEPDAVNFWMGDTRAVTSMHKDHYENLYCVVSGWKTFILLPPTDQVYIPYERFQAAHYQQGSDGRFDVIDDNEIGMVPWISVDPLDPDLDQYPLYKNAHPICVTVEAGQTLYLPSLWFHHVQQSQGCIAVNFWYDMEYDIKYNYFKFVENLKETSGR